MTDTKQDKPKRTRTPRTYESIEKGALELHLADRVKLIKALTAANKEELDSLQAAAERAKAILNGTGS